MPTPRDHYFSEQPAATSRPRRITAQLRGETWQFDTDAGTFSPEHIDPGSRLLIEEMEIEPGERVLDVGAGYGPVGLVAARLAAPGQVILLEVNPRAAQLARENALLNGLDNVVVVVGSTVDPTAIGAPVDVVVTNPPSHAGKRVVLSLLADAATVLRPGGRLYLVGHKYLGVKSLQAELESKLGPVDTLGKGGGYRVLLSIKREA